MLQRSLLVLLLISTALIHLCRCVQHPELLLYMESARSGGTYCPGERAQLKCIFPEGKLALAWYVNDSKRPYVVDYIAEDLPGHSATTLGNYTILSIIKEKPYRGNYSCAVDIPTPGSDIRSNSVEILFEESYRALFTTHAEPDGIKATCISSGNNTFTVSVRHMHVNGCRRETVVEASGMICKLLSTALTMTMFECGVLYPNTSYDITARSNGHVDSVTCSNIIEKEALNASSPAAEQTSFAYLAFLGVLALAIGAGFGVVLGLLLLYRFRKRQHGTGYYSTKEQHQLQLESKAEDACHRLQVLLYCVRELYHCSAESLQNSAVAQFSGNPSADRNPFDSEVPETLLRSDSDESRESTNSANPLLAQQQVVDQEVKYALLDHKGPRPIPAPSPHEKVNYATIKLEQ